jgi:hypothetical protein
MLPQFDTTPALTYCPIGAQFPAFPLPPEATNSDSDEQSVKNGTLFENWLSAVGGP